MVAGATWLSVLLYLVPLAVLVAARSRRDREAWEIALDLPLGVALDLLSVLVLARFVRLESAVLVSRPLWIAGGVGYLLQRRRAGHSLPAWPRSMGRRELALLAVIVVLAVWLSMGLSRPCLNADRRWHIPLVASIRGQSVPFHNVYDPGGVLAYHFAGNVLAAELQTLSWNVLHTSLSLSLAHDVLFGLTAASVALLLHGRGLRGAAFVVVGAAAFLLCGPITLLRPERPSAGYSYIDYLRLSFRPPTSLAALLVVGFVGSIGARLGPRHVTSPAREAGVPFGRTWPALVACTAALSLTDEAAIGALGVALGAAWLVDPNAIHPRRAVGVWVFVALLAALVVPSLVFGGSLSPSAPRQPIYLTPWRIAGYHQRPLLLATQAGRRMLFHDTLSIGMVWLAGAVTVLRARRRRALARLVLFTTLAAVSLLALMRIQVSTDPEEGHRFLTGLMLATPLFGCWWAIGARGAVVPLLAVTSLALSAASTVHWRVVFAPKTCDSLAALFTTEDLHTTNCRTRLGARLGEATTPEYVAKPLAYWYDGCHPVYAPTSKQKGQHWDVLTGSPVFGRGALEMLHTQMLGADQVLRATCPPSSRDLVCAYAVRKGACTKLNDAAVTCELSASDREAILAGQGFEKSEPIPAEGAPR